MLYNPKWDVVYKGVSRREFVAWLETMPPDGRYDFVSAWACAVFQFLQSKGVSREESIVNFQGGAGRWLVKIVGSRPYTYGAALERARAAML